MLVILYMAAIVGANILAGLYGPSVSVLNAFLLIGLLLTTRDKLHDMWGDQLKRNMGALILTGSGLSYLFGGEVQQIAIASAVALLLSESVDAGLYHLLRNRPWYQRVNGSNLASAAVDSVVFPTLAFGGFLPIITLGQFCAKVFGGAIWSWVLRPRKPRRILVDPWDVVRKIAGYPVAILFLAAPVAGQVSVGVGTFSNEFSNQTVAEVVVLKNLGPVTPNLILSFDLHGDGKPVVLPQVGRDLLVNFPVILGADVGASAGPWDNYKHWEPHGSVRAMAFLPHGFKVISIVSWAPFNDFARAVVVKLDWTIR